jgi:hypothetical protein
VAPGAVLRRLRSELARFCKSCASSLHWLDFSLFHSFPSADLGAWLPRRRDGPDNFFFCTRHATPSRIIVGKEIFGFWQVLRLVVPYFGHAGQGGFLIYVLFLLYQFGFDDCYHEPNDYPFFVLASICAIDSI